ncbi:MAG TPA: AAA family ATPase [Syntrophobacteraceae bacterium]|nr:AAA family ATPase [Syntrophobacteraceae bacterium]
MAGGSSKRSGNRKKTIVVLGDWFLDENWLVAKHDSYSSSHRGNIHYITKHDDPEESMVSLCGASEIMAVLKSFFDREEPDSYQFFGFGAWNEDDNEILQCLLCPNHSPSKLLTPLRLRGLANVNTEEGKRRCPYSGRDCELRDLHLKNLTSSPKCSTNRIIRCYEGHGGGIPNLLYRFDWQLPLTDSQLNYRMFDSLKNLDIRSVIIEDHGKGVVQEKSISMLIKSLKSPNKIKWFVRSKLDWPKWMNVLPENKISAKLTVIDFKLAEHWHGERSWGFGRELGRASLELLGDLTGDTIYQHGIQQDSLHKWTSDRAVVLFDDNRCISKDNKTVNMYDCPGPKQLINIGRTTMLFNTLIALDLSTKYTSTPFAQQCSIASHVAYRWTQQASDAWKCERFRYYGEYATALNDIDAVGSYANLTSTSSSYDETWRRWNYSSSGLGVLDNKDGTRKLEIWRSKGALRKYICVGGPKRDDLNDLLVKIDRFKKEKTSRYPFNCLLVSSPGWGKSFLAKCLAEYFDLHYLEFSLSQMANTNDLINCFDSICSVQNMVNKKLLIFMDEINCDIQGHPAMSLLLSPIWDGSFIRDGKTYRILPAVWVFASTASIKWLVGSDKNGTNKGSDFVSRINGPIIQLDQIQDKGSQLLDLLSKLRKEVAAGSDKVDELYQTYKTLPGVFRTDQVYLGITLLDRLWGPITKVSYDVLQLFHDLLLVNGHRSFEFFVSKFTNIQLGVVHVNNVPAIDEYKELGRHVVLPERWRGSRETRKVRDKGIIVHIEMDPSY